MSEKGGSEVHSGDLRIACVKLRGMAYLIELCGDLPAAPLDEGDCFYGISLVLTDIHDEIVECARAIEREEIQAARTPRRKSSIKK